MTIDTDAILDAVLDSYALPWNGVHGLAHWGRVLENGLRIAGETGASVEVVTLFALLHDSRRENECHDPGHGRRASLFAAELRGSLFELSDEEFDLLADACDRHTDGETEAPVTVQACWDADRLDLGRVGIRPHPKYLCTPAARSLDMLRWANERAVAGHVPEPVRGLWERLAGGGR